MIWRLIKILSNGNLSAMRTHLLVTWMTMMMLKHAKSRFYCFWNERITCLTFFLNRNKMSFQRHHNKWFLVTIYVSLKFSTEDGILQFLLFLPRLSNIKCQINCRTSIVLFSFKKKESARPKKGGRRFKR